MMHMGRMVHVESEVNSDLPSSDATSSPGNPGITREQKLGLYVKTNIADYFVSRLVFNRIQHYDQKGDLK